MNDNEPPHAENDEIDAPAPAHSQPTPPHKVGKPKIPNRENSAAND